MESSKKRPRLVPTILLMAAMVALPRIAVADIIQELEDHLNSLNGTEVTGGLTFTVEGVEVTTDLLGFSFCPPTDPTLPRVLPETPPFNSYGCINDARIVGAPVADPLGVELVLTIDPLFLDLTTIRDKTFLCAESGGGTVTADAYANLLLLMGARIHFVEQNDCTRWVVVPGTTEFVVTISEMVFEDPCLDAYAGLASSAIHSLLESLLEPQFTEFIDDFIWERNLFTCGVSVRSASWASVKAIFE